MDKDLHELGDLLVKRSIFEKCVFNIKNQRATMKALLKSAILCSVFQLKRLKFGK